MGLPANNPVGSNQLGEHEEIRGKVGKLAILNLVAKHDEADGTRQAEPLKVFRFVLKPRHGEEVRTLQPAVVEGVEVSRHLQVRPKIPIHCFAALLLLVRDRVGRIPARMKQMNHHLLRQHEVVREMPTVHDVRTSFVPPTFVVEALGDERETIYLVALVVVEVVLICYS